jgi:hypothetical protein
LAWEISAQADELTKKNPDSSQKPSGSNLWSRGGSNP